MSISFKDALKAKKLRDFYSEQGRIYIVVDATSDDVEVPEFLKGDPMLRLVLNVRMAQPVFIRDTLLESKFSFSGVSHHCVIPMSRIWATYLPDEDISSGIIWDEDTPEMIRSLMDELKLSQAGDTGEEEGKGVAAAADSAEAPVRKIRHLRVVK